MKLAVVTQAVDAEDPVLGATVPKLRALADRLDELVVLTLRTGEHDLPENVRVKSIAASNQALRGVRFVAALAPERPDAVLAHMAPIYAVLAAPLARPVLLWFTHPQDSRLLRAATRVSRAVLTVDERSFPFASPKVRAIGHGIDVARFACREATDREPLRALALGRFSPVKNYDVIQRGVDRVEGVDVEFVGPVLSADDERVRSSLRGTRDAVPWSRVPELFGEFDVFVSATKAGSADKAVYEAAASCLPVLASSPALASLLPDELRFASEDELVARLEALKTADRGALGRSLRERVVRDHSVEHWADEVLRAAA
ncbi:MAG: glycosyltransferase family 4 protein [Gaiellaceae bacterium]